jgi:hypothetical protein
MSSSGAVKDSLFCSVPFREGLRDVVNQRLAALGKSPVEQIFGALLELMGTQGSIVLDGAASSRLDIEWPNDVPAASREYLRAQLLAEMQRQIIDILDAQTNALIDFQNQSFALIFHQMAHVADQAARGGSTQAN